EFNHLQYTKTDHNTTTTIATHASVSFSTTPATTITSTISKTAMCCYGTLGLESGVVRDSQLFASSVWEWSDVIGKPSEWGPTGARLNGAGLPWASAHSNQQQWLQVDLKKEKRITGITTTGSSLLEYQFYVSIFKGNTNYLQEVRNNFIPPIEARYVRISPTQWHQRIALKFELSYLMKKFMGAVIGAGSFSTIL
uniref:F5/8 type C domain-containing protein n=1 Tax=Oncorhynchus tshawytscha TaxID=74940 RepID=A0AAZ3SB33_ONCTS